MARQMRLIERGDSADPIREVPIDQDEFLIGRAPDCNLRLHEAAISRHHCMLRVSSDEVTLIDLGSSNGTFVNGQRVRSQAALRSGDEMQIEGYRFLVDLGDKGSVELGVRAVDPMAVTQRRRREMPPPGETPVQG